MSKVHVHRDPAGDYLCTDTTCAHGKSAGTWRVIFIFWTIVFVAAGLAAAWSGVGLLVVAAISLVAVPVTLEFFGGPRRPPK